MLGTMSQKTRETLTSSCFDACLFSSCSAMPSSRFLETQQVGNAGRASTIRKRQAFKDACAAGGNMLHMKEGTREAKQGGDCSERVPRGRGTDGAHISTLSHAAAATSLPQGVLRYRRWDHAEPRAAQCAGAAQGQPCVGGSKGGLKRGVQRGLTSPTQCTPCASPRSPAPPPGPAGPARAR